jgi:hypothetical protein
MQPMHLTLACPNCYQPLSPPSSLGVGEAITCAGCGLSFLYPGENVRPSAPETMVVRRTRFFGPRRTRQPRLAPQVTPVKRLLTIGALVAAGIVTFIGAVVLLYLWYRTMQIVSEPGKADQPAAPAQPAATENRPMPNGPPPRGMPGGDNSRRNRRPNPGDESK